MTPEFVGALIGGIATGASASAVVVVKWLLPVLRTASSKAETASVKADAASKTVEKVANEVGVNDPGDRLADTVNLIAGNTSQIIETQRQHGEKLAEHKKRIERLEDHPALKRRRSAAR